MTGKLFWYIGHFPDILHIDLIKTSQLYILITILSIFQGKTNNRAGILAQPLTSKMCSFLLHYIFKWKKKCPSICVFFSDECSWFRLKYKYQ